MPDTVLISEIYRSLQGESTFAGLPCVFVRLTGCNLRCSYCDTAYAFKGGRSEEVDRVLARVKELSGALEGTVGGGPLPVVELTGGEPLLQPGALPLMRLLADAGFTVLVETSGAVDIHLVDPRVRRIMDLKTPGSGEVERNRWENLAHLRGTDEVKFVVSCTEDYEWMKGVLERHRLWTVCPALVSWAAPLLPHQRDPSLKPVPAGLHPISRRELVERLIRDALPVRFQLQLHKHIWPADERGV